MIMRILIKSLVNIVGVLYPGYRGSLVTIQKNLDMTLYSPTTNGYGTTYPIPDMTLPLQAEEEGPQT
jgi:hypothetical protein